MSPESLPGTGSNEVLSSNSLGHPETVINQSLTSTESLTFTASLSEGSHSNIDLSNITPEQIIKNCPYFSNLARQDPELARKKAETYSSDPEKIRGAHPDLFLSANQQEDSEDNFWEALSKQYASSKPAANHDKAKADESIREHKKSPSKVRPETQPDQDSKLPEQPLSPAVREPSIDPKPNRISHRATNHEPDSVNRKDTAAVYSVSEDGSKKTEPNNTRTKQTIHEPQTNIADRLSKTAELRDITFQKETIVGGADKQRRESLTTLRGFSSKKTEPNNTRTKQTIHEPQTNIADRLSKTAELRDITFQKETIVGGADKQRRESLTTLRGFSQQTDGGEPKLHMSQVTPNIPVSRPGSSDYESIRIEILDHDDIAEELASVNLIDDVDEYMNVLDIATPEPVVVYPYRKESYDPMQTPDNSDKNNFELTADEDVFDNFQEDPDIPAEKTNPPLGMDVDQPLPVGVDQSNEPAILKTKLPDFTPQHDQVILQSDENIRIHSRRADEPDYNQTVLKTYTALTAFNQAINNEEAQLPEDKIVDSAKRTIAKKEIKPTMASSEFELFMSKQTVSIEPVTLEVIRNNVNRQPLEYTLVQLTECLSETNESVAEPEQIELNRILQELATEFKDSFVTETANESKLSITPGLTEKLLLLMQTLGYADPESALIGLVKRHGIEFLMQALKYLGLLANEFNRKEFSTSFRPSLSANTDDKSLFANIGRVLLRFLISVGLNPVLNEG
jgi:hypothetical protein